MPAESTGSPRPARLLCRSGAAGGTRFEVRGEATLGRDPESTVVLESPAVSSRHARIVWDEAAGGYRLEDLDSLNGTELDGLPVDGGERLGRLHVITLGGAVELVFQGPELVAARAAGPATAGAESGDLSEGTLIEKEPFVLPGALADPEPDEAASGAAAGEPEGERTRAESEPAILPQVLAALDAEPSPEPPPQPAPRWRLRVPDHEPPGGFPLRPGKNRVGRVPELEIPLDSSDVSRLHAVLALRGDELFVRDAGSRNGTWSGERRVRGETPVPPGTRLRFGGVEAQIEKDEEPPGDDS